MKRSKWLGGWPGTLLWILAAEAVGALSGFLTRDGAQLYRDTLEKPPLSPPGIVLPIVWSILYLLMGVSAARIARAGPSTARAKGLARFFAQLAFNFFWSILFFNLQNYALALGWLVVLFALILWMILAFAGADRTAALLQLPCLLWVAFAGYLNLGVLLLN